MKKEIRPLTSMRGIAASAVVLFHFFQNQSLPSAALQNIIGRGYLWVDFFFMLSGFVMAESHGADFCGGFRFAAYRNFLFRRLARIYPLYIVLTLALLPFIRSQPFPHDAYPAIGAGAGRIVFWDIANILMVQAWGLAPSAVGPGWSLSTEWASYLLFPLLIGAALYSRRITASALGVIAAMSLFVVARYGINGQMNVYYGAPLPVMRCVAGFSLGLLAWRLAASRLVLRLTTGDTSLGGALVVLAILFATCNNDAVVVLVFPAVIICAANNRGRIGRALSVRPLLQLGAFSYAIYLVHYPLLHCLQPLLRGTMAGLPPILGEGMMLLCVLLAALIVAAILHHLVELPAQRGLRACGDHLNRRRRGGIIVSAAE